MAGGRGMNLSYHISILIKRYGGLRKAARVVQIDPAYLHRLHVGKKVNPSKKTLKKLGLKRVVSFLMEVASS